MSKLHIFTIAYNAMPMITWHLPTLNKLAADWHWYIAEGPALNVKDTAWCAQLPYGESTDGTVEYLSSLEPHPRITVIQRDMWDGKVAMCNACLAEMKEPGTLLQMDADEVWSADQLEVLSKLLDGSPYNIAQFWCRCFVGPNLITTPHEDAWGNHKGEWLRLWKFTPGMRFLSHESPVMANFTPHLMNRGKTRSMGLMFDHYAWALPEQVRFKERYYQMPGVYEQWVWLQKNRTWPARLKDYFQNVDDKAMVEPIYNP